MRPCTAAVVVIAVTIAAGVTTVAQEQPPVAAPLALEDAIRRATAASHRLAELRGREGAARAAADRREAERMPDVHTMLGYQRTNHVDEFTFPAPGGGTRVLYPDVPDNYRARLELQWPIYTGGRLQALERAALAELEATGHDLAAARADLKLEVTRAFWALVTARESVRVFGEALRRVEAQLDDVRARFDAGFVPPSDVLSVEAQRARQDVLLIEARNIEAAAEADLAGLVGEQPGTSLEIGAALQESVGAPPPDAPGLLTEARASRAERAALHLRAGAASEREAAAAAARLPSVALVSGYDYARPNPRIFPRADEWNHSWDIGLNLTWSVWDAGRRRAETAEAISLGEASRARLAEFDRVLALEVRQRSLDLASARAQIAAAEQGVRSAAEARRVVQERVAAGVATTTDLLDAHVALLQAELDRTRALASTRLAHARLERALGQ